MKYRVCVILKEVYNVWVDADDDETAQILAAQKVQNGDFDVTLIKDSGDTYIEEVEE